MIATQETAMTIDRVGRTSQISPSGDVPPARPAAEVKKDEISISSAAQAAATKALALEEVNRAPDVRPEKIAEAKAVLAEMMQGSALKPEAAEKLAGILSKVLTRGSARA